MDQGVLCICVFAAGIAAGALIATATYAMELRRIVRFMRGRATHGNARLTRGASAPSLTALVCAINDELDRGAQMRIDAMRRQQEFQRDLSALSHDIRTPLMGAKGYVQLASDESDTDARHEDLTLAAQRIDATSALLDQLFAYTKASDPDLILACEPIEIAPLVERVLLGHYPAFERRGWEPEFVIGNARATLLGDRDAVERIVENLVVNALRHGAAPPTVTIADGRLSVANRIDRGNELDISRLFDRFYQADTARGAAGAGLGLATSAKLARAMGLTLAARLDGDVLVIELSA